MLRSVPLFPLNTVVFPGVTVPLSVFEDRYRAMIHQLLRIPDPEQRVFCTVAIREGYEVGERAGHSIHRIGCLLELTDAEERPDGSFSILAVARDRIKLIETHPADPFITADLVTLPDVESPSAPVRAPRVRKIFVKYRDALTKVRGYNAYPGDIPDDPTILAWVLAATCQLPLDEQQRLLEAETTDNRLDLLEMLMNLEREAMAAIPSLPAINLARNRWSPN
ncbi:LON peptidase substrate-binding domain-containing protein [Nocardioides sp. Bht2]|uniref:LON peptidase substrate-binding domain-containing protein n=1 Tax=Nocardioides sp. Bht2 TaxID=3392297 RepID=UPI0039B67952